MYKSTTFIYAVFHNRWVIHGDRKQKWTYSHSQEHTKGIFVFLPCNSKLCRSEGLVLRGKMFLPGNTAVFLLNLNLPLHISYTKKLAGKEMCSDH